MIYNQPQYQEIQLIVSLLLLGQVMKPVVGWSSKVTRGHVSRVVCKVFCIYVSHIDWGQTHRVLQQNIFLLYCDTLNYLLLNFSCPSSLVRPSTTVGFRPVRVGRWYDKLKNTANCAPSNRPATVTIAFHFNGRDKSKIIWSYLTGCGGLDASKRVRDTVICDELCNRPCQIKMTRCVGRASGALQALHK